MRESNVNLLSQRVVFIGTKNAPCFLRKSKEQDGVSLNGDYAAVCGFRLRQRAKPKPRRRIANMA